MENLVQYQSEIQDMNAQDLIAWALRTFGRDQVVLASSLGAEDQLLTHMVLDADAQARIFTLDTGRQFAENYDLMQRSMDKYGFNYEVGFPDADAVRELLRDKGPNLMYQSIADRKACCKVRKIDPLRQILGTAQLWITGLRAEQAVTRSDMQALEWDQAFGLYKLNPLILWSETELWDAIRDLEIPYNDLHDKGFPSIGCQPCTRAVEAGEDVRAGRWWWELPEQKECGLHIVDGKIVRPKKTDASGLH